MKTSTPQKCQVHKRKMMTEELSQLEKSLRHVNQKKCRILEWILNHKKKISGKTVKIQARFMVQLRVLFIGVNILVLIIVLWFHKMLTLEETGGGEIYNNSL